MSDHPTPRSEHSPEYLAYLGSPEWAAFRIRFFRFHVKACLACGAVRNIQLHHRTYERLTHEWLTDVVPLCGKCHDKVHAYRREKRVTLWAATAKIVRKRDQRKKIPRTRRKPRPGIPPRLVKKSAKLTYTDRLGAISGAKERLSAGAENRLLMLAQIRFHQAEKSLKS